MKYLEAVPNSFNKHKSFPDWRKQQAISSDSEYLRREQTRTGVGEMLKWMMIQTFYHIAALGDWKEVLDEQLSITLSTGLAQNPILTTFVGAAEDLDWAWRRSKEKNVHLKVVRSK